MLTGPIFLFHPMLGGFLSFGSYSEAIAVAEDLGLMWDLNHIGYLKSRCTICHL